MITLSVYGSLLLNVVVGVLLPMLVAAVTKADAAASVKSFVLLALSAVYGLGSAWVNADAAHQGFDLKVAFTTAAVAFGLGVVNHFGWLKSFNITGSNGLIARLIPVGFGAPRK